MFNDYVWQLYLSTNGRHTVDRFVSNLSCQAKNFSPDYIEFLCDLYAVYSPCPKIFQQEIQEAFQYFSEWSHDDLLCINKCGDLHSAREVMTAILPMLERHAESIGDKAVFQQFTDWMPYYSTLLAIRFPNFFVPYYFKYNYNIIVNIAREFALELPPVPKKSAYLERFFYYADLCDALQEFREQHNLSYYEYYAFLYDFAPNMIGGIASYIMENLPEPVSAYFIGSAEKDLFYNPDDKTITPWQCHPDTQVGDNLVMYMTAPVSSIDSIWRSVSVGFNDPFFYYYRCCYIARPQLISRIPLKTMKADPILGKTAVVRKNMQGVNGVELLPNEYNRILELAGSQLKPLTIMLQNTDAKFLNEKDVENKLIQPLLAKLGYSEADYSKQMVIRVGNKQFVLIPDYVLLPKLANGHHSAFAIIEAKRSIPSASILAEAQLQTRSYAKQLGVSYAVVASQEKIWISSKEDDYDAIIFCSTWANLEKNPDDYYHLLKLLKPF